LTRFLDFDIPRFMKSLRRRPASIAKTRWAAYAAAGAATALGSATSAEAEIHYSGVINAEFPTFGSLLRHFPIDDSARLIFLNGYGYFYHGNAYYPAGAFFGIRGAAVSNRFRGYSNFGSLYVSQLPRGEPVSQGVFAGRRDRPLAILGSTYGGGDWGSDAGEGGFVGFRFDNGAGMQYGWARLKLVYPCCGAAYGFTLVDYAWGDPGDTIRTGQRSSAGDMVDTVTDSGSLGLLALGGAGLLAWRKRRGQATQ
jgi:hypothetical protein